MEEKLNNLILKYKRQWDKNGMGSGISYSKVISDLEKIIPSPMLCEECQEVECDCNNL